MWVRFYDGDESNVLMEKLMAEGETYTIPDTASDPKVRTGRPDAFTITVGGKRVPPLAEVDQVMSDVEVSAKALLARDGTSASATGTSATGTSATGTSAAGEAGGAAE